jgi:hypothetical protein
MLPLKILTNIKSTSIAQSGRKKKVNIGSNKEGPLFIVLNPLLERLIV